MTVRDWVTTLIEEAVALEDRVVIYFEDGSDASVRDEELPKADNADITCNIRDGELSVFVNLPPSLCKG